MRTHTINARTSSVSALQREVQLLRSFVIGFAGRDWEGQYRPAFVARIQRALRDEPAYRFATLRDFLARLRSEYRSL